MAQHAGLLPLNTQQYAGQVGVSSESTETHSLANNKFAKEDDT